MSDGKLLNDALLALRESCGLPEGTPTLEMLARAREEIEAMREVCEAAKRLAASALRVEYSMSGKAQFYGATCNDLVNDGAMVMTDVIRAARRLATVREGK